MTVSEDHRKRTYPEYVQKMSEPFEHAGGMVEVYEGVVLGGADKFFGLDDLNLWLRRHRYAAYNMDVLLPIAHLCVERAVRARLMGERPGVAVMAEQAAGEILRGDLLRYRRSSRGWMYIYDLTKQFPKKATPTKALSLRNFETGPMSQSGKLRSQPSGGIYRRLSFSSRKTNRTSFLAVKASARLCWYLLTSLNLRS